MLRSRYLLAIAGLIILYELVSNIIDFQLAATVERSIQENLEKDSFFAFTRQLIGIVSISVQLFLTAFVMKRFGVRIVLLFLPAAVLLGSVGFIALPALFFAAMLSVSDNALNYSINQSAKEALYTPTSPEATYNAKAVIDGFLQRFGKIISAVLNLAFAALSASGVRWLSLVVFVMLAGWFLLIQYVGRRFRHLEQEQMIGAA